MPTKKSNHPLIVEIQLGKTVEDVIEKHFDEYELMEDTRDTLPDIVREIIRINKKDLQFQVISQMDRNAIIILNAESDFYLEYSVLTDDYDRCPLEEEACQDCGILNEIVRRLYGISEEQPEAMLTTEEFVKRKGTVCPYCKGSKCRVLDETTTTQVITGCKECGATWATHYQLAMTGFTAWRHGR